MGKKIKDSMLIVILLYFVKYLYKLGYNCLEKARRYLNVESGL